MLRTILLALCASLIACTAPLGEEEQRLPRDLGPDDHQETVDLFSLPATHEIDPWDLLPPSPID